MSKKEKIVIGINDQAIRKAKMDTENYLIIVSMAKDRLKGLTEGNVSELNMDLVDAYLNNLTGFKNGSMSAMAYNLQEDYSELMGLIDEVNKGTHLLQFITKGKVDNVKIEQTYTSYLKDEYVDEFYRIQEAVDILNESNMYIVNHSLNFGRSKIYFDAQSFSGAKAMSKR